MIKSTKPRGAQTPEYISKIPMPPVINPRNKRVKTLVKHCTQTQEFDAVINAAIADGWTLDEIRTINNQSSIMLFALLHRFETETETGAGGAEKCL